MGNIPDARGRILSAATKIFAEKSFAGSRIDDIAKTANVPKSLIYYHFKSKDAILETLMDDFTAKLRELLIIAKTGSHKNKNAAIKYKLEKHYKDFIKENVDLIRILLIESLKKDNDNPLLFKIAEEFVSGDGEEMKGEASYDINERLIAEFFTSLVPIYTFFCFQEKWGKHFNIPQQKLQSIFVDVYEKTHGAYHKNRE